MVKVTRFVLSDLFDQYNKQFFEGKLVKPQLATYTGSTSMGIFNVCGRRGKEKTKIMIARNVRYTQEELRDILVHEMIHLYLYQKAGPAFNHRRPFVNKMNELNAKYGLDVRKNCKHLKHKYIRKRSEKKDPTGWLHQLKVFLRSIF